MSKTKIVIVFAAIAALTLAIVGLASAQIAQNQPFANTSTDQNTSAPNPGFWGWIGNCFGFRANQPYANPYVSPPQQGGYYGNVYGYGYGSCMGR
jgi:hypothetical protein